MKMQITSVTSYQIGSLMEQSVWSKSTPRHEHSWRYFCESNPYFTHWQGAKLIVAWSLRSFYVQIPVLELPSRITYVISGTRALLLVLLAGVKHEDKSLTKEINSMYSQRFSMERWSICSIQCLIFQQNHAQWLLKYVAYLAPVYIFPGIFFKWALTW